MVQVVELGASEGYLVKSRSRTRVVEELDASEGYLVFCAVVVRAPYVVVLGGLDDSKGLGGGHGTPWWHRGGLAAAARASGR